MALSRLLLRAGTGLFLAGLLTGLAVPLLSHPRMGLASHLEGVLNGILLIAVGLMWDRLRMSVPLQRITFGLLLYAAVANWLATLLAAALAATGSMPLAGGGTTGSDLAEGVVLFLLLSLSFAAIAGTGLLLYGLRGSDP